MSKNKPVYVIYVPISNIEQKKRKKYIKNFDKNLGKKFLKKNDIIKIPVFYGDTKMERLT